MALNFPPTPNVGDQHTEQGKTWEWDGTAWVIQSGGGSTLPPQIVADPAGPSPSMTIDSSGRVLVGTDTARSADFVTASIQNEGTDQNTSSIQLTCNSSASPGTAAELNFSRSRGSAVGDTDAAAAGDNLGIINFTGADGTDLNSVAAQIRGIVDADTGSDDMPGRLAFYTTENNASSPTERFRINNQGAFGLSGANFGDAGQVLTSQGGAAAPQWATPAATGWTEEPAMGIDATQTWLFDGIPQGVRQVKLIFHNVGTFQNNPIQVNIGSYTDGILGAGYLSNASVFRNGIHPEGHGSTAGFQLASGDQNRLYNGQFDFIRYDGNLWTCTWNFAFWLAGTPSGTVVGAGHSPVITGGGFLNSIQIFCTGGFNAGGILGLSYI
jgi:hypothetical protein